VESIFVIAPLTICMRMTRGQSVWSSYGLSWLSKAQAPEESSKVWEQYGTSLWILSNLDNVQKKNAWHGQRNASSWRDGPNHSGLASKIRKIGRSWWECCSTEPQSTCIVSKRQPKEGLKDRETPGVRVRYTKGKEKYDLPLVDSSRSVV